MTIGSPFRRIRIYPEETRRVRSASLTMLVLMVVLATQGVTMSRAFAAAAPAMEPETHLSGLPGSFADLVQKVKPAVVNVSTTGKVPAWRGAPGQENPFPPGSPFEEFFKRFFENQSQSAPAAPMQEIHTLGSGFIIDPAGYVVTNHHVIDGADQVTVMLEDGERYDATLVGADAETDLALLKIDAGRSLPYVSLGDSDAARVGDWVIAVGDPFGLGGTVTAGIISARGRDLQSGPYDDFLQIDAPINRGNSGGPLFNDKGEVIGINSAIYSPNGGNIGIGFAIPSNQAKPVFAQLREHGYVARGWLGVEVQPVTPAIAESLGLEPETGALVAGVVPESPADKAGVRPGDVIVSYAAQDITRVRDLPRRVARTGTGQKVDIRVWRDGATRDLEVVIAASPEQEHRAAAAESGAGEPGDHAQGLGLAVVDVTPAVRERYGLPEDAQGVLVVGVEDGSPAAREGIRAGDVIEMVGQKEIATSKDVVREVEQAAREKRKSVLLLVKRGDASRFIAVPIGQA